jgi:hypothetical protein
MHPEDGHVVAAIFNKGPQIPLAALRSIFDPLRRAAPVRQPPVRQPSRSLNAGVGLGYIS